MAPEHTDVAPRGLEGGHLAAIVEQSDDAILSKDSNGTITSWNPAAERIYGYSASEAIGQPISILIPPHRAGEERQILNRILEGKRVNHYETERVTKEGRIIHVSLTVSPLRDARGEVVGASVIARDVTRRRRTLALASRLQDVTSALSREVSRQRVVRVVLERMVGALGAEAGALGVVDGEEVTVTGSVGYSQAGMSPWLRFPIEEELPMTLAIRTAESVWATSRAELEERFPSLGAVSERFGALAVLPLAAGGRPFGAIALSFRDERAFDLEERAFLVAASQQAAYALDRAAQFEAEQLAGERQRFLAEAGELLTQSLDPDTTLERLAGLAVHHVADWCGVEVLDENGQLRSVAVAHSDEAQVALARSLRERYPLDPQGVRGAPNVIRTGVAELYSTVPDELLSEAAEDEEHLNLLTELGLKSAMVVPLRARGRVFGAITFVASDPDRSYNDEDLALAQDLARRAALAVDNARLFRQEHEAAVMLQRSLLPHSLPTSHGHLEFDVRYRPAGPGLEVGGDWYEVVIADDGSVTITIGDVAGRGIRAASVMGRVRPVLRAYALDRHAPCRALAQLDRLMKESERREMTTLFHLRYDPDRRRAEYVRAGHPPGLVRTAAGEVIELDGGGTPPLGILDEFECNAHTVDIPAGSLVLLYTDGLIERRDTDLAAGLERLKRSFAEAPAKPTACLDWLEAQLETDAVPDDVAMLAMST